MTQAGLLNKVTPLEQKHRCYDNPEQQVQQLF
jgi:hypothetical protein